MDHNFTIDDREYQVALERRGGDFVARIGDREHLVHDVSVANGTVCFRIGNRAICMFTSDDRRGTHLHYDGRNYLIHSDQAADEVQASHHHGGDGSVEAPMPGSIVSVNVSAGDLVESGTSLVVIESMKMQNDITSPVAGAVQAVNCKAGDQVGFGDILVEIEPASG